MRNLRNCEYMYYMIEIVMELAYCQLVDVTNVCVCAGIWIIIYSQKLMWIISVKDWNSLFYCEQLLNYYCLATVYIAQ